MRIETFYCLTHANDTKHILIKLEGDIPMWACEKCVNKGVYGKVDYLE